jgi:hypothetical protein
VHKTLTAVGPELAGFVWALGQAVEEIPAPAAAWVGWWQTSWSGLTELPTNPGPPAMWFRPTRSVRGQLGDGSLSYGNGLPWSARQVPAGSRTGRRWAKSCCAM